MKHACLVVIPLLLLGCKSTAQEFVDERSKGKFIVKGTVVDISGLNTNKWEDLKDGFAITVAHPGCKVTLRQDDEASSRKTTFPLVENDLIVHGYDGDFILSALAHNRPDQVGEAPTPAKAGEGPKWPTMPEDPAKPEPAKKDPVKTEPAKKTEPAAADPKPATAPTKKD